MEQAVIVMNVIGEEAMVRGRRLSACGQCAGQSACGTLGSWVERFAEMRVDNSIGARPGEAVMIDVPDGVLMRAALRLYGIPMLAFFVAGFTSRSLALAYAASAPDLWAAGGAALGLGAAFAWLRHSSGAQASPTGRIVRISPRHSQPGVAGTKQD